MKHRIAPLLASLALAASAAQADTVSYTAQGVDLQRTRWDSFLDLQQFDPTLGTLQWVTIELTGTLFGSAAVESRNNRAATLTTQLGATLTLARPDLTPLVTVVPLITETFNAARYDGTQDFAGTSGIRYTDRSALVKDAAVFTSDADLALFTGQGLVHVPVSAQANSRVTGPGNFVTEFTTLAGAGATITYTYAPTAAVPEPQGWSLLLTGLGLLGFLGRRRSR